MPLISFAALRLARIWGSKRHVYGEAEGNSLVAVPAGRETLSGSPLGKMLVDLQEDGPSPQEAKS